MTRMRILALIASLFIGALISSCNLNEEGVTNPPEKEAVRPASSLSTSSAIGCWDFDEGEGVVAGDNCGEHDGEVIGASWVTGVCGTAVAFDGSDDQQQYVALEGGEWLTQSSGTIEAWVMVDPDETGGRIISTEAAGWHNGLHITYGMETSGDLPLNGGIFAGIHSTEDGNHYAETYIDDISKGEWHFLAFVWDGDANTLLLFVDGVVSNVTSPHPGIVDTGEPLTVGCWQNEGYGIGRGGWFKGSVDDMRFYDRTLSVDEISSHYAMGCFDAVLDIKPGSCPNPLNPKSRGKIPVALLGSTGFDVRDIDVSSLLLEGVAPIRNRIKDVATPVNSDGECACTVDGPDGSDDLTLKFRTQEIVGALEPLHAGETRTLTITGSLLDGTSFTASDCVIIVGGKPDGGDWDSRARAE